MPKLSVKLPRYRRHSARNLGFVEVGGKRTYFPGTYGSAESKEAYRKFLIEWETQGRPATPAPPTPELTIVELMTGYLKHVKAHYLDKEGKATSEQYCILAALRSVKELYGRTVATAFGPLALKACQQRMVKAGMSRGTVNRQVHRVRRMFRWAAAEELLPVAVYQALVTVPPLKRGRTTAHETDPITPVADSVVERTLPHLPAVVADMVRLQRATGARPNEICMLRSADVDTSGDVWQYVPSQHKTEHHGKSRVVMIGPRGQDVLRKYLLRPADSFCFSPCDSERKRRAERHEQRATPMSCGNIPGSNVQKKPKRTAGERYTSASYRRAIQRACKVAGVEVWAPNQLRHAAATEIRAKYGIEAARTVLGHSTAFTTEIYAEKDLSKAAEIARQVG